MERGDHGRQLAEFAEYRVFLRRAVHADCHAVTNTMFDAILTGLNRCAAVGTVTGVPTVDYGERRQAMALAAISDGATAAHTLEIELIDPKPTGAAARG